MSVQLGRSRRSRSSESVFSMPESAFMMPESAFTLLRNPCSRSSGIGVQNRPERAFEPDGHGGQQPSGPYRLIEEKGTSQERLTILQLDDFEKDGGPHWASLTMKVKSVGLRASLQGETCTADITPTAPALDVIER